MRPTASSPRSSLLGPLFLAAALSLTSGCYHVHVVIPNTAPTDFHRQWVSGWLWGAVGGGVDTARFCGGRPLARVSTHRSFGNMFLSWLTFGIYTPSTVTVACGGGQGYVAPSGQPQPYYPPPQPQPYYPAPQPQPGYYQPAPPPRPVYPAPRAY